MATNNKLPDDMDKHGAWLLIKSTLDTISLPYKSNDDKRLTHSMLHNAMELLKPDVDA